MKRTPVVLAYKPADMFWEALIKSIKEAPDVDVIEAHGNWVLTATLLYRRPRVLLCDRAFCGDEAHCKRLLKRFPSLSIIVLDSTGAETLIRIRDLGYQMLMHLIRTLAERMDDSCQDHMSRIRYLRAEDMTDSSKTPIPVEVVKTSAYTSTREHLDDVRRWLNLSLHQRLAQESKNSGLTNTTPGWAMSAQRARLLLGDAYSTTDENVLKLTCNRVGLEIAAREAASSRQNIQSGLVALLSQFGLNANERRMVLLALAVELDGCYGRVFGFLNDDLNRRRPTLSLMGELALGNHCIAWDARQILEGTGPLGTYRLLINDPDDSSSASETGLRLAPEIVAYLLAEPGCIPVYGDHIKLIQADLSFDDDSEPATCALKKKLDLWREATKTSHSTPIIQLVGSEAALRWFERVATRDGDPVVEFNLAAIGQEREPRQLDYALGAARVAALHNAILLVTGIDGGRRTERQWLEVALISRLHSCVRRLVVHGDHPLPIPSACEVWQVEHSFPGIRARAHLWQGAAQAAGVALSESDARSIATTAGFDEPEIEATLRLCKSELSPASPLEAIQIAARKVSRNGVPGTVRCIEPVFTWNDIVLPEGILSLLRQIPTHVRYAAEVLEDWGYCKRLPYGRGVATLFSGPSGTGKTMAAQIIAHELGVELFQIDLAETVSKYIGETEKNLDQIFDAAERASAVLLFDEADALFGKRTEVKDAHDRYANVEVAFLLQRMESYSGLAILTTNFKQNVDHAFLRRLRFVVEFPMPDARDRASIWQRVFPAQVPFANDVDVAFLARRLNLTGGHIQQIALRAAFSAVAEYSPIAMRHIVRATRDELTKLGMLNAERSLADFEYAGTSGGDLP